MAFLNNEDYESKNNGLSNENVENAKENAYSAKSSNQKDQPNNDDKKQQEHDSNKKAVKVAAKGAANAFGGPAAGAAVDKLAKTKIGDKILNKGAEALGKIPGISKATKKLDDSGAMDAADKGLSMASGGAGAAAGANASQNGASLSSPEGTSQSGEGNKKAGKKSPLSDDSSSNESDDSEEKTKDSDMFGDLFGSGFFSPKNKLIIIGAGFLFTIILIGGGFLSIISASDESGSGKSGEPESEENANNGYSTISMTSTTLSLEEFKNALEQKAAINSDYQAGYRIFANNADTIYNLSIRNNINPEMVVIRAVAEGFSPGSSKNNYWGMGCRNKCPSCCISYASFADGVLGYIRNISQYNTVESMMSRYAYIGGNWYSPGNSSDGGCYYYNSIKQFLSEERSNQVANACSVSCTGSSCMKTNSEDQEAYSKYQVQSMVNIRKDVFGISEEPKVNISDDDEEEYYDDDSGDSSFGQQIVNYSIKTFDSYSYSQSRRFSNGYVDCSSLVYRTYKHFNINMSGNTAAGEYEWCRNSHKLISGNNLKPGDLLFFNNGTHRNSGRTNNIGHVAIYAGNGKQFAAHTSSLPQPAQVSVSSYNKDASYFCRPYK